MPKHPVKRRGRARGKLPAGSNPKLPPTPTVSAARPPRKNRDAKAPLALGNAGIVTGVVEDEVT